MRNPGCENNNVSPTPDQHARARRIAAEIAADLAQTGFALPGTLTERMTRCGYPGCRCHADPPRLHGPYHQWTRKWGAPKLPDSPSNRMDVWKGEVIVPTEEELLTGIQG